MKTNMKLSALSFVVLSFWLAVSAAFSSAQAQGTAFTYQGRLNTGANPATGLFNLTFSLYNASAGGILLGGPETNTAVPVTNGLFTVLVDFGANVFTGSSNWLQIGVTTNAGTVFSPLSPRNQVTPAPYAIYAETANAAGLSGTIPAGDLGGTYGGAVTLNNAGNSFTGDGSGLTSVNAAELGGLGAGSFWQLLGNAGTKPGLNYVGTKDNTPLNLDVNGLPVLQVSTNNSIVMANGMLGTVGYYGYEVALGQAAKATGNGSVAIGWNPTSSGPGSVAIGESVTSSGNDSFASGYYSQATANDATAMGYATLASGPYSMALGYLAQAQHEGSFVWSDDSSGTAFASTASDQFLIRAQGGVGIGTASPQNYLSVQGGLNIDQANDNAGILNNGNTNGFGLSFGATSGEGIASQRQSGPGGNQYGLDFYTDFTKRMSITQSGFVGIGTQTAVNPFDTQFELYSPTTNGYDGMWIATGAGGIPFYGYSEGGGFTAWTMVDGSDTNKWKLWNNGFRLTVDTSGNVGIGTTAPGSALEVANGSIRTDGNPLLCNTSSSGSLANDGLYNGSSGLTGTWGINSGYGPGLWGYEGGTLGGLSPNIIALSWDAAGDIWVSNNCSVGTLTIRGGADLAEPFNISSSQGEVSEGAVVVIDEQNPGHLKLSDSAYDVRVAGVVSGANGINPGIQMHQQGILEGGKNVALTGRVYVQADASNGAIRPGDMLTTSATPGHAMRVSDHTRGAGAILGKAMTGLSEGKGMVLVLVTLQ